MQVIMCRYGEIHLKGANRGYFLHTLERNIKNKLKDLTADISVEDARVVISNFDDADKVLKKLQTVFGLTSVGFGEQITYKTPDDILKHIASLTVDGSFKVNVNRADKTFPVRSPEFSALCGDTVLKNNQTARVDVNSPEVTVLVDIRQNGLAYIFNEFDRKNGVGGLPVSVSGRALCLISGGIDSPVSAYLTAKRGMSVDFIHFASPPYTSDMALEKVKTLCGQVCRFSGNANLYIVPFTEIQQEIHEKCRQEFMITIMRRFMVAIAEKVGLQNHSDCLITGENLAQVASQTIQGIASNNFVATRLPILRPLICFDKNEIILRLN
jgi:thiamine biosynthesis protein ThiI